MSDATSNSNSGTYVGGYTLGQAGALQGDSNTAVSFNGATGAATAPNSSTLQVNQVAIELWVKKSAATGNGMYVTKNVAVAGGAGTSWFQLMNAQDGNHLEFRVTGDTGASLDSASSLAVGTWYYVVATYDGTTAKLYLNGVLDGQLAITATPAQTADPVYLGRRTDGYYNNAVLDEVAIYPAALSNAQVAAHWQAAGYVPGAPTAVTASIPNHTTNQANVSWTAPSTQGTSAITSYTVTPHVGSSLRTPVIVAGSPPATTTTITGLSGGSPGTAYTFTVVATNATGTGAISAPSGSVTVTGTSYPYAATVLADAPTAYWRFGEASGASATDITNNGVSGTYLGGATLGQTAGLNGDPDKAVLLNGSSGYISVPSTPTLQSNRVSIELWIKKQALTSNGMYVTKNFQGGGGTGTSWFQLMNTQDGNRLEFRVGGDVGASLDSVSSLAVGTWYDVVATYDGTVADIYINGVLDNLLKINVTPAQAGDPILIGQRANQYYNNATLDDLAIYPNALTSAQVLSHWSASGVPPGAPTGVTATAGTNQATVSWTAPAAGSSAITGYTITPHVGTTLRTPKSVAASIRSTAVTGLSGGAQVSFTVVATSAAGTGSPGASGPVTPTGSAYPYASTILADSPAAYWRLGEALGPIATDAKGNGTSGTYSSSGVTFAQAGGIVGDPDPAITMDGSVGIVDLKPFPVLEPTTGVSVEAWVKPSNQLSGGIFQSPAQDYSSGYKLLAFNGHVRMYVAPTLATWAYAESVTVPATGKWTHIVGTWDGATIKIYVNGQFETSQPAASIAYGSPNQDAAVGQTNGSPITGSIDEVAVYGIALSASQVMNHWTSGGYAPGAPTGATASSGVNRATVSWIPPTYPGPSGTVITGYRVLTTGGPTQIAPMSVAASPATVTGLSGGSLYSFTVMAQNTYGFGPTSAATANVTPTGAALPGAPTGVVATVTGSGQVTVTWSAPSDGGSAITSYTVTPYTGGAAQSPTTVTGSPPATSTVINGLTNNQYYFQVTATNGVGIGPAGQSGVVTPTTLPGQPPFIRADVGNQQVTVTWGVTADGGSPITSYTVTTYLGTCCATPAPGIAPITVSVDNLSTIVTGLTKEVGYSFQVYAANANGNGPGRAVGPVSPYGPAGPPSNIRATTGSGLVILQWGLPADDGGSPISGYTVTPSVGGVAGAPMNVGKTLTSLTLPGLVSGSSYTFSVLANNVAGAGSPGTSSVVTPSAPLAAGNPFNSLSVYVGYTQNNSGGPPGAPPTPWQGSPNVNFVGYDPGVANGGMDAGAIRIDNSSSTALTITDVLVRVGGTNFDQWGNAITVPAGGSAILTQMTSQSFDTSDVKLPSCSSAQYPTIAITISGISWTYLDTNQILTDAGTDANCNGQGESRQWEMVNGGPSPAESLGDGPIDEQQCSCSSTQYPVNNNTGNFYHTFMDLAIPGRGIPLSFTRTYNSLSAGQDGPVGFGWADNYNAFLTTDVSGDVTVHEENGGSVTFTPVPGQFGYQAPTRVLATLQLTSGIFYFTRADKSQLSFNSAGQLVMESDRNGYQTTFTYNSSSQLTTVTDPGQRTLTFAYFPDGQHIRTVTDSAARSVAFVYDASNNLQQVTDVGGGLTTLGYDANHLLQTITDPNTGVLRNTYDTDGSGRVTLQIDPMQYQTQFSYNGNQTTITDPNNNVTAETYQDGDLVSRTLGYGSPQSATWSYQYDPVTNGITQTTDPNHNVWTNAWDANGNLLRSTDPLQHATINTYNGFNETLTQEDPLLVTTTYGYNGRGNMTSVSRPLVGASQTSTVTYAYNDVSHPGDVSTMTDANGKLWQYTYDQYGNRSQVTDPLGNITTYTFDGLGRMLTKVNPKGNVTGGNPAAYTTTSTYDAFSDLKTVTDQLGHLTQYNYDGKRNLTQVIDANTHRVVNTYNLDNQLTQLQRADNSLLKTAFDGNGNVISQIDGLNNPTTYTYDALNRKASMTDADQHTSRYTYDGAGNLLTVLDPMGRTTTCSYDSANQLKTIAYSDVTTSPVTFNYDNDGQRLSMSDGTGQTTYSYDSLHRQTQSTNAAGQQVQYGHDLSGNLTSLTYPGGINKVTRTYDDAGRLHTVTDWLGHTTTFTYDVDSNLTTETYPNTTIANFTYDASDQVTGITDTTGRKNTQFLNFAYTRDPINQLKTENSASFGYNTINQLTTSGAGGSFTYAYDAGDNLQSIAIAGSTTSTLAYDPAHQLTSYTQMSGNTQVQKYTYTFDNNGNRATRTDQSSNVVTNRWNQANQMTGFTAGGTSAGYVYNGDGLRMSKTVNSTATPFVWDTAEGLPLLVKDGPISYVTGPGGFPLEQINGSTVTYYHQDQLGSTRAMTNSSGLTIATYSYDAYGNLIGTPPTFGNPFQFAGQYTDAESGLIYLRARYYDPATGQFMSSDPMVGGTREAYAYIQGNPLNGADPTGLCSWAPWAQDFCGKQVAHNVAQVSSAVAAVTSVAAFAAGAVGLEPLAAGLEGVSVAASVVAAGSDLLAGEPGKAALDALGFISGYGALRATVKAMQNGKGVSRVVEYILEKLGVNSLGPVTSQALRDALSYGRMASNWRLTAAGADLISAAFSFETLSFGSGSLKLSGVCP